MVVSEEDMMSKTCSQNADDHLDAILLCHNIFTPVPNCLLGPCHRPLTQRIPNVG